MYKSWLFRDNPSEKTQYGIVEDEINLMGTCTGSGVLHLHEEE